jgi:ABC-type bacteriocin/lantibiotic exporter with double-glycine peptidase domain
VLILDGPPANPDPETERLAAANLCAALTGCTTILLRHGPALAEIADQTIMVHERKAWLALASA